MELTGLTRHDVVVDGLNLAVRIGGHGPVLMLLHGFPQNHRCWAKVLPALLPHFTCVLPDLRGYGDSDAPADDVDHSVYSKRRMAQDIVGIMDAMDIATARVLGHDRGARVAYRMALDHPSRVSQLGIIEVVPTGDFWRHWNADLAMKAYHWTFLAQPAPLPERMINADPRAYIDWTLRSWVLGNDVGIFPEVSHASYLKQAEDPARIAAMCADYRSGATIDRQLDEADARFGRRIDVPTLFVWAKSGFPAQTGDAPACWRSWAPNLTDYAITCGHFAMEENPEAVLEAVLPFFKPE